jgi:hypothetical protein
MARRQRQGSAPEISRDHRRGSVVDGSDDLGVVDTTQVTGGDRQVGMPELASWRWITISEIPSRDISTA